MGWDDVSVSSSDGGIGDAAPGAVGVDVAGADESAPGAVGVVVAGADESAPGAVDVVGWDDVSVEAAEDSGQDAVGWGGVDNELSDVELGEDALVAPDAVVPISAASAKRGPGRPRGTFGPPGLRLLFRDRAEARRVHDRDSGAFARKALAVKVASRNAALQSPHWLRCMTSEMAITNDKPLDNEIHVALERKEPRLEEQGSKYDKEIEAFCGSLPRAGVPFKLQAQLFGIERIPSVQ